MTELFDQEAPQRRVVHTSPPQPAAPGSTRYWFNGPMEERPASDPDPSHFSTAAAHSAAYVEQKNQEYRLEQIGRNLRGMVYLSKAGVSQTGIDEYLAGNTVRDGSPLRVRGWRFDAWTQRHFWDIVLVLLALLTIGGFAVFGAHAEFNQDSTPGFVVFVLGIFGMTAEVIRRGRE